MSDPFLPFQQPPPSKSVLTGEEIPPEYIHASSTHFRDATGRTVFLRGVNLTSSAKTPVGAPLWKFEGFWEGVGAVRDPASPPEPVGLDFSGRVLDLRTADIDLERLRSWGFNCLRYVYTWESIEWQGPGIYDRKFIEYTIALLRKCKEWGFYVYMDPHQDLWSRFSGGDGAPFWTLPACGLDPVNFVKTNATTLHCEWVDKKTGRRSPSTYPAMLWATNYQRLANLTMWTMFFGGKRFAPKCIIDGVNIQDWLMGKFLGAVGELTQAIVDAGDLVDTCVIGHDSINEPNEGLLGCPDLSNHSPESILRIGSTPKPFEAMVLGMGFARTVENYKTTGLGSKKDGCIRVDPQGTIAWTTPEKEAIYANRYGWVRDPGWAIGSCIWASHGVWDISRQKLLRPDYFAGCEMAHDFWLPHWVQYGKMIRSIHKEAILFVHSPVFKFPPNFFDCAAALELLGNRAVFSSHFYDGLTLITKHWNWFNADALGILRGAYAGVVFGVKIGESAIRNAMCSQLRRLRKDTFDFMGNYPTMMGEIGIPYDLDQKKAYETGDYANQVRALDASLNACDGSSGLNYTIWTYCPDNCHQEGDQWNGEDLSIWCRDEIRDRYGRSALKLLNCSSQTVDQQECSVPEPPAGGSASLDRYPASSSNPYLPSSSSKSLLPSSSSRTYLSAATSSNTLLPSSSSTTLLTPSYLSQYDLDAGSRASTAFVRPYPIKSVGLPTFFNFDIKSSKFFLSVRVDAGAVLDPEVCTEIFLPFLHYANRGGGRKVSIPAESTEGKIYDRNSNSSTTSLMPNVLLDETDQFLTLNVCASDGTTWETEGQILRWRYEQPTQGSVEYKITITRAGGKLRYSGQDTEANQTENTIKSRSYARFEVYAIAGTLLAAIVLVGVIVGAALR